MLLNEEDEKKKREEDIKRLFGTKNSEENINKTPKVEISDAYNKRIQDPIRRHRLYRGQSDRRKRNPAC